MSDDQDFSEAHEEYRGEPNRPRCVRCTNLTHWAKPTPVTRRAHCESPTCPWCTVCVTRVYQKSKEQK